MLQTFMRIGSFKNLAFVSYFQTEKLIKMILESQTLPDMTDDVAAVCAALDTDSQASPPEKLCVAEEVTAAGVGEADQQEELLDDIEFPEEPSPDPEPPKVSQQGLVKWLK